MKFGVPQVLWIVLIAVPAVIAFFYWSWRVKQKLIQQFVRARLQPTLMIGVSAARQKFRLALLVAAVAAILLAVARPQWGFAWEEAHQKGLDIMIAVDTSKSMLAQDARPNRIEKTKLAIIDLMRLAKTDRLGLVAFAGNAFLQAPLTVDEQAFEQAVAAVSVGIVPVGGTSLSSAIRTALNSFEKGDANHKVIVLFTDGEDHDADADTMAATKEAADAGVRIFTIGVGTPAGELLQVTDDQGNVSFVKDEDGNVVKSRLNETLLREIATKANGFYLPLQGGNPMETLYTRGLAPLPKSGETTRLTRVYRERYHWPLGFAVLCLVLEALLPESQRQRRTERRQAAAAAMAALLFFAFAPISLHASPSSAFRDYKEGDFNSAYEEYSRLADQKTNDYRLDYDAGTAAYQAKKFEEAGKRFESALNSPSIISDLRGQQHAYYNLGNTLYHLGEPLPDPDQKKKLWQQSIEDFNRAYHLDTNDIDAKNNLAYVKKMLEEMQKQQQQQQQNKNGQNDQDQDQNQKNQQNSKSQQQQDKQNQNNQQQQQSAGQDKKDQQQQQAEQKKKDEEKARQEQAKKDEEKKQQQQQQASEAQQNGETNSEQTAMAQVAMTPEEARQLLDQQKDDEKVLIFGPENKQHPNQPGPLKDW